MLNQVASPNPPERRRAGRSCPVMNQQLLRALAEQRRTEVLHAAAAGPRRGHGRRPHRSVRERTGWTLVELGLRLAGQPARDGQPVAQSAR